MQYETHETRRDRRVQLSGLEQYRRFNGILKRDDGIFGGSVAQPSSVSKLSLMIEPFWSVNVVVPVYKLGVLVVSVGELKKRWLGKRDGDRGELVWEEKHLRRVSSSPM